MKTTQAPSRWLPRRKIKIAMRKVIGIGETILTSYSVANSPQQPFRAVRYSTASFHWDVSVFPSALSVKRATTTWAISSSTSCARTIFPQTMSMCSPTGSPRITRFPEQPERCGIHLLQRLSQAAPGRGISADSGRRHRNHRVVLCPESGTARQSGGATGTRTRHACHYLLRSQFPFVP